MAIVCVKDACGWLMFLFIYGIMLYSDYVFIYWVAYKHLTFATIWAPINIGLFNACLICLALSHIRTVITDPGRVPFPRDKGGSLYRGVVLLANEPHNFDLRKIYLNCMKNDWTECRRCQMLRPPRSHHCRTCKRCVRRMDHHCPWVNNCVGAENQKYFLQFLFWTALSTFYAGAAMIWSWASSACDTNDLWSPQKSKPTAADCNLTEFEQQNRILHAILILMLCALFCIFSVIMLIDQVSCVMQDRSTVEKASGEEWERQMTSFDRLREVCGRIVPFCWLLPCVGRKLPERERFIDFTVDVVADDDDERGGDVSALTPPQIIATSVDEHQADERWHVLHHHRNGATRRQGDVEAGEAAGGCVEEMRPLASCTTAGGATGDDSDNDDEGSRFVV